MVDVPTNFARLPWNTIEVILDSKTKGQLNQLAIIYPNIITTYYRRWAERQDDAYFTTEELFHLLTSGQLVQGVVTPRLTINWQPLATPSFPRHLRSDGVHSYIIDQHGHLWIDYVRQWDNIKCVEVYPTRYMVESITDAQYHAHLPDLFIHTTDGDHLMYRHNEVIVVSFDFHKIDNYLALTSQGALLYLVDIDPVPTADSTIVQQDVKDFCCATLQDQHGDIFAAVIVQHSDGQLVNYALSFVGSGIEITMVETIPRPAIIQMFCAHNLQVVFLLDEQGTVWTYPPVESLQLRGHAIRRLSTFQEIPQPLHAGELFIAAAAYDSNNICYVLMSRASEPFAWRAAGQRRELNGQGNRLLSLTWARNNPSYKYAVPSRDLLVQPAADIYYSA